MIDINREKGTDLSQVHKTTHEILSQTINPVIANIIKYDSLPHHNDLSCLIETESGFDLHRGIKKVIMEYEKPVQVRAQKVGEKAVEELLEFLKDDNAVNMYNMLRKYTTNDLPLVFKNYVVETILRVSGFDSDNYWHVINDLGYQVRNQNKDIDNNIFLKTKNIHESIELIKSNIIQNVTPVLRVSMDNVGELASLVENGDVLQYAPGKYAGYYKRHEWMHDANRIGLTDDSSRGENIRVPKKVIGLINPMFFARKFIEKGLTTESFLSGVAVQTLK